MKGFTIIECIVILAILGILTSVIYTERIKKPMEVAAAFAAWEKHTGNPKGLTKEEWEVLVKTAKPEDNISIIPLYMGR